MTRFGEGQEEPERSGWFTIESDGSRRYFHERHRFWMHLEGPERIRDPARFLHEVGVDLDPDERAMLILGLHDWGGPAYGSDALAVAMGFANLDQLCDEAGTLAEAIQRGRVLSVRDWTRALLATEFAFISSVLGTGVDEWVAVHGERPTGPDPRTPGFEEHWFGILRRLQEKIPAHAAAIEA